MNRVALQMIGHKILLRDAILASGKQPTEKGMYSWDISPTPLTETSSRGSSTPRRSWPAKPAGIPDLQLCG